MSKTSAIPAPYGDRIGNLRRKMEPKKLDAYLVFDRMDQYWLTGFTGEDGAVLVTPRAVVLLTDGRFDEAADIEAPYAKKVLRKQRTPEVNAKAIAKYKPERIGFDPSHMTVGGHAALKQHLKPAKLVEAGGFVGQMRAAKTSEEVEATRVAIDVAQQAFERVRKWIKPGQKEREIAARLEYEMKMLGAQGPSFPTIVAVGPNSSIPHYAPADAEVTADSVILIDWGAQVNWYTSDLTRVIWPEKPSGKLVEINKVVREAHDRAIEAARPGMTAHQLDKVARDVIKKAGYGDKFGHALGHGIGLNVHEAPRVGMNTEMELQAGMIITIEPGIYLPGVGGVRIEDDVLLTDSGSEVLTSTPIDRP